MTILTTRFQTHLSRVSRAKLDWLLVVPLLVLAAISLIILFSIKLPETARSLDFSPYQQVVFVIAGLALAAVISRFDYQLLKKWSLGIFALSLLLLILVLWTGEVAGGAQRWVHVFSVRFQPAELAKASLIFLLARIFSSHAGSSSWRLVALSGFYLTLPVVLIALQPDISSALICVALWFAMAAGSSVDKRLIVASGVVIVCVAMLSMPLLADYQRQRLVSFLQPSQDLSGAGYNSQQALITIGSGGIWGQGLSGGSQSQLLFLPEQHTDFIFAVVAEKLGFIGVTVLLLSLSCLIVRMVWLVARQQDRFAAQILMGIMSLLGIQIILNIGMNIGLLPVTGLPLPFVSYGGTHTLVSYGLIGVVLSITRPKSHLSFKQSP